MIVTGAYFSSLFDVKTDQAYTGFLDNTKKNRLFQNAFIQSIEDHYIGRQEQKMNDELSVLINTGISLTINNNSFYTAALAIFNCTNVGTTITVTTLLPHNLITGNSVVVSGIAGFTTNNPNGTFTVVSTPTTTTFTYTAGLAPTGTYTKNTGEVYLSGGQLIDMIHPLAIKTSYNEIIYRWGYVSTVISDASNTTPIRVTFGYYNNIRNDNLTISGITGNTNANGTFYVKKVNELQCDLYTDKNFQTPVAGNGVFGGTPVLTKVQSNYARPLMPDEKISPNSKGTVKDPRYITADKMIKLYPDDSVCSTVEIDYIRLPLDVYGSGLFIDVADVTLDLTLYYSEKMLDLVMEKAIKMAAITAKDDELYQASVVQSKDNP